jgi:hypothetical protein
MTGPLSPHLAAKVGAAIKAARHFQFVAHGHLTGNNSPAAFERDAQNLTYALAALGFTVDAAPDRRGQADRLPVD